MKIREESYNEVIDRLYNWKYPDKKTIEVTFQVTEACTLSCKYCYQGNKSPKVMTLETAKKYIDVIFRDLKDVNIGVILDFIGGEPLLQPQLISDIIDYWDYKCIMENLEWGKFTRFSICSNGTEYFKPEVQALMNKLGNSVSFTVSIDGNKELHDSARVHHDGVTGSYDEAIAAAKAFEEKTHTIIGNKMTIAPSNIVFMYPALKHYLNCGAETIHANCVYEEGWTIEDAQFFYKELKRLADYKLENYPEVYLSLFDEDLFDMHSEDDDQTYCGGRGSMLACDPDGVLYPCIRYMPSSVGRDRNDYITCGTVDKGMDWTIVDKLQECTRRIVSDDECYYCPIGTGCGECAAYSWQVTGRIDKKVKYICEMHKARALANVYYWNKYYKLKGEDKHFINHCPEDWALKIIDREELAMLYELSGQH